MKKPKEIILGVCGSIAAYKAGDIIRRLQDQNCQVTVVMTKEAQRFIPALTLSALSGRKVLTDMFDEDSWKMSHIASGQKADLFLIAPATANVIGKLSAGIADDFLTCLALATQAKILIAPAMNDVMYKNKIVQENISKLKKMGVSFIEPVKGKLACGTTGEGHLAEVDDIVRSVVRSLK
ncbi:MAG: flavoprotein [Candidatus Omnitrophota bacterium]